MNSITFDCSLFQVNDPQLANQVMEICTGKDALGLQGLNNVKLTWAKAKAFVKKQGQLYNELVTFKAQLKDATDKLAGTKLSDVPYIVAEDYCMASSNIDKFEGKLRHIDTLINDEYGKGQSQIGFIRAYRGS